MSRPPTQPSRGFSWLSFTIIIITTTIITIIIASGDAGPWWSCRASTVIIIIIITIIITTITTAITGIEAGRAGELLATPDMASHVRRCVSSAGFPSPVIKSPPIDLESDSTRSAPLREHPVDRRKQAGYII
jgi:hypothetical protein